MACLPCCCHHCWNEPPTTSLCSHPLFSLCKCSTSISECQWVHVSCMKEFSDMLFASYMLPCQMPFCQSAPLLPYVTWQQSIRVLAERFSLYCYTTNIASDAVGQCNKIGGIASGEAFLYVDYIGLICPAKHILSLTTVSRGRKAVLLTQAAGSCLGSRTASQPQRMPVAHLCPPHAAWPTGLNGLWSEEIMDNWVASVGKGSGGMLYAVWKER